MLNLVDSAVATRGSGPSPTSMTSSPTLVVSATSRIRRCGRIDVDQAVLRLRVRSALRLETGVAVQAAVLSGRHGVQPGHSFAAVRARPAKARSAPRAAGAIRSGGSRGNPFGRRSRRRMATRSRSRPPTARLRSNELRHRSSSIVQQHRAPYFGEYGCCSAVGQAPSRLGEEGPLRPHGVGMERQVLRDWVENRLPIFGQPINDLFPTSGGP